MAPKLARVWWTSTYEDEERSEIIIAASGLVQFTFEEKLTIPGCVFKGGTHSMRLKKERSPSTRPIGGTSWTTGARCAVENQVQKIGGLVCSDFCFGRKKWSWTIHAVDRINRRESKKMMRLFRFKRGKDEPWVEFHSRCCKAVRLLKACGELWGWVCDQRPDAVFDSLKQVLRWRSSRWWHARIQ